ncbi:MAG: hypothetical protein RMZ43_020745 [Nostoc sp. CmiVER01]|uniref:hypothetical protein n=1 Tax=Nostoc sp. CmiVER01 TaxID=3075384 RepID=UPI002AD3089F|nr:hypothetical protein [Nostoc sp. CmiVER01]MDZ8125928.1 hypothetical protein [Nostoc sp. CmiVER01]
MIRRLALVISIAVLSAVAFAPKAGAVPATQDVTFNGTVVGVCTFTGTTAGALVNQNNNAWVEASTGSTIGNIGTAAQTTVNCTSGGQLAVSAPVKVAAPANFTDTIKQAVVYDGTNFSSSTGTAFDTAGWAKPTTALTIPANTNRTLNVAAIIGVNNVSSGVPVGTYNYKVTLTATPN